jgi:biopolymer transport protein TolR
MAMSAGGGGGSLTNEINVTPMIDVLLVLLIIFMMVVPMARKAIDLQLPTPNPAPASSVPTTQIVMEVLANGTFAINKEVVQKANLASRLKQIYDPRPEKIIFVKGDPTVTYAQVIEAMDIARGSGVKVIGVPPKDPTAVGAPTPVR